jgi:hypothetical protein
VCCSVLQCIAVCCSLFRLPCLIQYLFCRHIGLFCGYVGLVCGYVGLFSRRCRALLRIYTALVWSWHTCE